MTIEELADLIEKIDSTLLREDFDTIDSCLEYISDEFGDDLDGMENEELVTWLRATYLYRDKLQHWIAARDRTEQILNERDLNGKYILRGLYE